MFEESSWYVVNLLKLLWHYGLNPLRMYMWVEDVLDKFMRYVGPLPGKRWERGGGKRCETCCRVAKMWVKSSHRH